MYSGYTSVFEVNMEFDCSLTSAGLEIHTAGLIFCEQPNCAGRLIAHVSLSQSLYAQKCYVTVQPCICVPLANPLA